MALTLDLWLLQPDRTPDPVAPTVLRQTLPLENSPPKAVEARKMILRAANVLGECCSQLYIGVDQVETQIAEDHSGLPLARGRLPLATCQF